MKYIQMEYPNIEHSALCDGTWHRISVVRLWYVVSCSSLLVMEYFDYSYHQQCVTVLVCTPDGVMKAPLIDYEDFSGAIKGLLEPADPDQLPDKIEASDVSFDLTDLTLRLVQEGFTMTRRVASATAPPPPPPPPPDGPGPDGPKRAQRHRLFVARDRNGGRYPLPPTPMLMGEQALIVPRCRVATLFIFESRIYFGFLENAGLTLLQAFPDVVLSYLSHYFIIWRDINFALVKDDIVISNALTELIRELKETEDRSIVITEIDYSHMPVRELEVIPRWVRRYAHRYSYMERASEH